MTRVVHLVSSLATGGTEMMLFKILGAMRGSDVSNVVVSLIGGGAVAEMIAAIGVPVYSLNMRRGVPDPLVVPRLWRMLRRQRADVLQTWLYHADFLGLIAGKLAGVPAMAWNIRCSTTDDRNVRGLTGMIVRMLARLSAVPDVVVVNSAAGQDVHERLGYRPRRWEVIPNGFDLGRFKPDPEAYASVRVELGLAPTTALIGLIARYDPLKDHATFLRAAAELRSSIADAHFLLAGLAVDPSNPTIAQQVRELGLESRVHLLGERRDIPRLTAALDIATCSSTGEGFPNVVGEAMACAVPVVTTDVGDVAHVVGDTGIVAPIGDAEALARGFAALLTLSGEERRRRGARARTRVAEQYDLSAVAARYIELYRTLGAQRARAS